MRGGSGRRPGATGRATGRATGDGGFTLVELLITIAVIGVVVVGITIATITSLRARGVNEDVLVTSRYAQTASVWFPSDVASARPGTGIGTTFTPTTCGASLGGTGLVWFERFDGVSVAYVRDATNRLLRVTCAGGSPSAQTLAEHVQAATATVTGNLVRLDVTSAFRSSSLSFTLRGVPRASSGFVPPFNFAGCAPQALSPLVVQIDGSGNLPSTAVTLTTAGTCGTLSLVLTPGTGGPQTVALSGTASPFTGTLPAIGWTAGTKTVRVLNDGVELTTFTVLVTSGCSVTGTTAFPVTINGAGGLVSPATVQVTTSGSCSAPSLVFTPGTGSPVTLNPTNGASPWSFPLPATGWTPGTKEVTVGGTLVPTTLSFVVAQQCTFVSLAPTAIGIDAVTGNLVDPSTGVVQLTTSGSCTAPTLTFNRGTGSQTLTTTSTASPWTFTLPSTGWTTGPKPVTVGGVVGATGVQFNVSAPCGFVSSTPASPVTVTVHPVTGALVGPTALSVTTAGGCGALTLELDPGSGTTVVNPNAGGGPTSWTFTLPTTGWVPGNRPVAVRDGASTVRTLTFAVVGQCTLLDPTSAQVVISPAGALVSPATLAVTTAGSCSAPQLQLSPGASPQTITGTGGPTAWTFALPASGWTPTTPKTATLVGGSGSISLAVRVQCTVTTGATDLTISPAGALVSPAVFTMATSGGCTGPTITFTRGAGPVTGPLAANPGTTYQYTLPTSGWTAGSKPVSVADPSGPTAGAPSFTVGTCSLTSVTPTTVNRNNQGRIPNGTSFTVTTSGCTGQTMTLVFTPASSPLTISLTGGPTTWTGQIPNNTNATAGTKTLSVRANGVEIGTASLVVT